MMQRLIDADWFRRYVHEQFPDGVKFSADDVLEMIDNQPTAYDVEKVVEDLKEKVSWLHMATKYGNADAEQQEFSYSTMMMYEVADIVDDLIEIVRNGGVEQCD